MGMSDDVPVDLDRHAARRRAIRLTTAPQLQTASRSGFSDIRRGYEYRFAPSIYSALLNDKLTGAHRIPDIRPEFAAHKRQSSYNPDFGPEYRAQCRAAKHITRGSAWISIARTLEISLRRSP